MQIITEMLTINSSDHLFLEGTSPEDYSGNTVCNGCGFLEMMPISIVTNSEGDTGIITGLCTECGYIKKVRNLSSDAYLTHFSEKWLSRREEEVLENKYVFDKIAPYINKKGSILDVGCGLGERLLPFHNSGYDVFGVEPSIHRSGKGKAIMKNIKTATAEQYLLTSDKSFDAIFIFNVLQFLENPFHVLEMAINRLSDDGILYFRVGAFAHKSNFSQFAHIGVVKNQLSLYALKNLFNASGVYPIYYNEAPFELILSKHQSANSDKILSSAIKVDDQIVERYARKTLKLRRLKFFGKVNLSYNGRKTTLNIKRPVGNVLPVIFEHNMAKVPLLLK